METEKNKLENLLSNNLLRKKERIAQDLQEWSSEDRNQRLEMLRAELESVNARIGDNNARFKELDDMIEKLNKQQREHQKSLEHWKNMEREHMERITDDTKELEKITNKQSLLLKKVGVKI